MQIIVQTKSDMLYLTKAIRRRIILTVIDVEYVIANQLLRDIVKSQFSCQKENKIPFEKCKVLVVIKLFFTCPRISKMLFYTQYNQISNNSILLYKKAYSNISFNIKYNDK